MTNFSEQLDHIQQTRRSLLCVGLDTDPAKIPSRLRELADPVYEFNRRIIESTADLVCAYKINLAFYESLGESGWTTLRRTLGTIPEGVLTIGDGKRGDIGNSAEMYARVLLDDLGFGSTTVNPYMGEDAVAPFARDPARGVFVLAVTSNPGAKDFQYLKIKDRPLYEAVIRKVRRWNTAANYGLVVGATRPRELRRVRELAPDLPVLIPGVGAQGGDLRSAVRYGCDAHGGRAIINASRSILYASQADDFADAARRTAREMRDAIESFRPSARRPR